MTTKNLVPRLDGQGKLGVKGASNLKWKEVNAVSGSFDLAQIDDLQNQDGNDLIVGGTGITVTHASGSSGFEYTISASSTTTTLSSLTDVSITSVADNDLIYYNNSTSSWENIDKIDFLYPDSVNYQNTSASTVSVTSADFDNNKYFAISTSGAIVFDLPDASTINYGQKVSFYTLGSAKDSNVTIRNSSSTITDFIHTSEPITTNSNSIVIKPNGNLVTVTLLNNGVSGQYIWFVDESASQQIRNFNSSVSVSDSGLDGTIDFRTEGSNRWKINSSGHLLPASNSDYDIGSAELKVRHLFLSDNSLRFGDASATTAPYYLSVDTANDKFKVSVDSGGNWENIALASEIPSLTGYATETFVNTTVNDALQGLDAKEAVDAATTGVLSGYGYASNVFTESSASGALTIDGFVLSNGDRVLVKDQGSGNEAQHGIYVVGNVDGSSAVTLTRASDLTHADTAADDFDGAFVFVLNGTDHAGRSYVAKPTTSGQTTVGTDGMTWVTFTSSVVSSLNELSDVTLTTPASGQILRYNGSGQFVNASLDIADDTTPQLGGDLDLNGNKIVTVSNAALSLAPNGTGVVTIEGNATGGSGALKLNCENNSHGVTIKGPPHSAAATYTLTLPNTDGTANQVLKTDGNGGLDWVDQSSGGATTLDELTDVDTSTVAPTDGKVLVWNNTDSEWQTSKISFTEKTVFRDPISITLSDITSNTNVVYVGTDVHPNIALPDPSSLIPNVGDTVSVNVSRQGTEGYFHVTSQISGLAQHVYKLNSNIVKTSVDVGSGEWIRFTAIRKSIGARWYVDDDTTHWLYTPISSAQGIVEWRPGRLYDMQTAFTTQLYSQTFAKGKPVIFRNSDSSNNATINGNGRTIEGASSFTLKAGKHVEMIPDYSNTNMHILNKLNRLVDVGTASPTNGQALAWSSSASEWQPTTISSGASTLGGLSDVTLTSPSDNSVLTYDNGSSSWIDGQSLSLTGNIITTANVQADELQFVNTNNKLYMNQFANNIGTDLDSAQTSAVLLVNKPLVVRPMSDDTLTILGRGDNEGGGGTGIRFYDKGDSSGLNRNYIKIKAPDAKLNASYTLTLPADDGVANQVLETDGNGGLSWVTPAGGGSVPNVTSASPSSAYTITTHAGIEEVYLLTPSADVTATIPSAAAAGSGYKYNIKNLSATYTLTVKAPTSPQETIDGQGTFDLSTQYSSITIVSDGSNWHII